MARFQIRSRITSEAGQFVVENRVRAESRIGCDGAWEVVSERQVIDRVPRTSA